MKGIALYLLVVLACVSIQSVYGSLMSAEISLKTERQLKHWLGLYDIPYNASKYLLTRISLEALKSTGTEIEIETDAESPADRFRVVSIDSLIATGPQTILSVDKQPLTLIYENLEYTAAGGLMMHWLGHVQGDPDSFVRLTFEGKSVMGESVDGVLYAQMSGTIITNGKTIKIRPAGLYDYHILYEVKDGDSNYLLQLDNESESETVARWLEAVGIQRDLLADIPRDSYTMGINGALTGLRRNALRDDYLSYGEIGQLEIRSTNDLARALEVLGPYFALTGPEEFTLKRSRSRLNREEVVYHFAQSINGIPVHNSAAKISVDKTSHKITHVFGLVSDAGFAKEPSISEDGAKMLVSEYVAEKYAGLRDDFTLQVVGLFYNRSQPAERDAMRIHWGVGVFRNGSLQDNVLVDSETGKTLSLTIISH